jgi:Ca2+-transporting ATPase
VHILWINLITDTFPALALGMEPAEADLMRRPPRGAQEGIFSGGVGVGVVYQGALVTLLTLAAYFIGARRSANDGMTMAFLTMSMAEIFHAYNMRSQIASIFSLKRQNWFLVGAMVVSFLLTTGVLYLPFMAALFGFAPIALAEYAAAMGLALSVVPLVEGVKWVQRKGRK